MFVQITEYRHPVAFSKAVRFFSCRRDGFVRRTIHRGDQRDAEVGQRGHQQFRRRIARVHIVLARQQAPPGQAGVDRRGHLAVGHGRIRGLHVHDQMRGRYSRTVVAVTFAAGAAARGGVVVPGVAGVAGLGDVHLVAVPEGVTLDAPPSIEVIRRGDAGSARRETLRIRLPPSDHLPSPLAGDGEVVLHEHDPQHLDLMQPRQERQIRITAGSGVHRFQQGAAVAAAGQRELVFLRRGGGHPPGAGPCGVSLAPRVVQVTRQPVRRGHRQGLQAGPHRLPGQLQPVQVPYRGNHVSGIGAHLPAGRHQPVSGQPLQQRVQHHLVQAAAGDPGPELAQDRVIEARIGQVKAQRVLPVDPGAHRLGGLPVGQILRHLEDRHQGQAARRPARLAPFPAGARELLIGQPLTQLVTHYHRQRALPLALVHRRNGRDDLRRGLRPRLRLHTHHEFHPAAETRGRRPQADPADNKIQDNGATPLGPDSLRN